ncbi:hypothetical protein PsYK624_052600 [Phanerochaete sordida]|uniref:F-box domain-containing protein n=1 Tax=Phanerochaete sordida TaxID=48140 RepID=A0A9P3G7D5_9APHY|nr:hypothetical protein PsYK624_052600 [Phanerochaete sordida]
MHPALKISEILRIMLQISDDHIRRRTAAAVAMTCRTFYEPGSDALWGDMPSLRPLLRCLPTDAVEKSGFHPVVAREAGGAQWARFVKHAARVRTLKLTAVDFPQNERHMRVLLFMLSPEAPKVIPNLRTLEIALRESVSRAREGHGDVDIAYLPLLLGPRTQTLKLRTKKHIAHQVLVQAALACPELKNLELEGASQGYTTVLWHISSLEQIHFYESSSAELLHPLDIASMAYLPSLRQLSFPLPDRPRAILQDQNTASGMFPALETLEIRRITSIPAFSSIIKSISSSRMQKLQICIPDIGDFDDFHDVIRRFAKFPMLRCLSITGYAESRRDFPVQLFLAKLAALEELTISLDIWEVLPAHIPDLGRAWPRLRRLELLNDWDSPDPRTWPLDVLSGLGTHLPHLEHLRADMSAAIVPPLPAPGRAPRVRTLVVGRHSLRPKGDEWIMVRGYDEKWYNMARYISQACPNATMRCDESLPQNLSDRDRAQFMKFDWKPWKQLAQEVGKLRRNAV